MKKNLFVAILCAMPCVSNAAISDGGGRLPIDPLPLCIVKLCTTQPTLTTNCETVCNTCDGTTTTTSAFSGVTTKTSHTLIWDGCPTTTGKTVDCSCQTSNTYSCAAGYYGTPTNSLYGCTSCATATGNANATSNAGATTITDCYIPNGAGGTDAGGTYTITGGDCKYTS